MLKESLTFQTRHNHNAKRNGEMLNVYIEGKTNHKKKQKQKQSL